jgi:hypothetical protein
MILPWRSKVAKRKRSADRATASRARKGATVVCLSPLRQYVMDHWNEIQVRASDEELRRIAEQHPHLKAQARRLTAGRRSSRSSRRK